MADGELNIEDRAQLQSYLHAQFQPAEEYAIVEFEPLAGGVSGRTVRVRLAGGQEWVLKQALAKLRVAADWFSDPRRIHREALGMQVLAELTPGDVPRLIFDDETHHVLGMEAVPQPHENWKSLLLAGRFEPEHALAFGVLLGAIHRNSRLRAEALSAAFADRSFFESLRLEPYYEFGAVGEPRAAPFFAALVAETREHREALVHGDFSPKNILVRDWDLILLDHEVIHWGDPAFDVGFASAHLLSKSHHIYAKRDSLRSAVDLFWKSYRVVHEHAEPPHVTDVDWPALERRSVRHTLGCLLARVVGRSPLEYLTPPERDRQRETVVALMHDVPRDISELIERFIREIETRE